MEARAIEPKEVSGDAVLITLRDYELKIGLDSKKSGTLEFVANNLGQVDHEFVIVPMEDGQFGEPVADTESFGPGESRAVRIGLRPGTYALVCLLTYGNLATQTWDSHMALGMQTTLEVIP